MYRSSIPVGRPYGTDIRAACFRLCADMNLMTTKEHASSSPVLALVLVPILIQAPTFWFEQDITADMSAQDSSKHRKQVY